MSGRFGAIDATAIPPTPKGTRAAYGKAQEIAEEAHVPRAMYAVHLRRASGIDFLRRLDLDAPVPARPDIWVRPREEVAKWAAQRDWTRSTGWPNDLLAVQATLSSEPIRSSGPQHRVPP